jgi:nucleoside-diphosphate-sugar epimerase
MKAFVTGGTGFIGRRVVELLRERGDEVVALVRTPSKATDLVEKGVTLVEGDLSDEHAIREAVKGSDAVFHIGAIYKVGIPKKERPELYEANVEGTKRVLDSAIAAGVARIVYVSTGNVFGNTKGQAVDETYERDGEDFVSYYDETKYRAHKIAKDRIAKGAPIVIVQPGVVYGPGDHSAVGDVIDQVSKGKLPAKALTEAGFNMVYVDDVAAGIMLAYDKGRDGEAYALGGERLNMGEMMDRVAAIAGRKPPRFTMPTAVLKALSPLGPVIGPAMGMPRNMKEAITASDKVTYWFRDDKARSELGYTSRDLDTGLKQTLGG